ncbi:serine hydrolase [Geotalea sp. SG265]|uniref:serine hydrolase n=1 Tax=Geotalea sp. SG265 TaxID=2922867 RepID=UPI001FAEEB97|nr:serine hydrolase [Geotalea sp. SG265]
MVLVGIGWYAHGWYHCHDSRSASRRVRAGGFRFISPLLDVELPEGVNNLQEPIHFKAKVAEFVEQQKRSGRISSMSVYFRDLFDGPWFGINENARFDAASMMKVPVMIAWLKRAEKDPRVLDRQFVYDGKEDLTAVQTIKPRLTIAPGRRYSVEQLLRYMINYSDNNATTLLYNALPPQELNDVLDGMDIDNDSSGGNNAISVHGYSGFFRILYNAAYLNREMSEKALQLLTLEDFPQGIAAGIPKGTAVAAKFGESHQGSEKQLHEFGIVYHPKGPYIIGIMTRGRDATALAAVIRDLSALIYGEVSAASPTGSAAAVR